jgi:N-formylmaleamate deformylase
LLAFWLAASEPTLVGPIVAVDGVPFLPGLMDAGTTVDAIRPMAENSKAMMASLTPEQFAMQTRMSLTTMVTAPEDLERLALQGGESDPATVAQAMFELMTTDLRDDVASIESPVLLMAAGATAPTPEGRARLLRSYEAQVAPIPNHRVVIADHARHFIMLDAPDFFQVTLTGFLADASGHERAR